jgi:hypothetical protein
MYVLAQNHSPLNTRRGRPCTVQKYDHESHKNLNLKKTSKKNRSSRPRTINDLTSDIGILTITASQRHNKFAAMSQQEIFLTPSTQPKKALGRDSFSTSPTTAPETPETSNSVRPVVWEEYARKPREASLEGSSEEGQIQCSSPQQQEDKLPQSRRGTMTLPRQKSVSSALPEDVATPAPLAREFGLPSFVTARSDSKQNYASMVSEMTLTEMDSLQIDTPEEPFCGNEGTPTKCIVLSCRLQKVLPRELSLDMDDTLTEMDSVQIDPPEEPFCGNEGTPSKRIVQSCRLQKVLPRELSLLVNDSDSEDEREE